MSGVDEDELAEILAKLANGLRRLPVSDLAVRMRAAMSDEAAAEIFGAALRAVLFEAFRADGRVVH